MAGIGRELLVGGERLGRQIEQPGGHDRAAAPDLGDLGRIEGEAVFGGQAFRRGGVAQQVEALGEGLHHAVFDAVMDHLDEVAGADGSAVKVALLARRIAALAMLRRLDLALAGRERREDRLEPVEGRLVAADHQAVAAVEPMHAARGPDIHVVQALGRQFAPTADIVLPEGVAAVDQRVARREQAGELGQCRLGDLAGRQHHPDRARRLELGDHVGEIGRDDRAIRRQGRAGLGIAVVDDAVMPGAHQPAHDVATHPAEADHSKLHRESFRRRPRDARPRIFSALLASRRPPRQASPATARRPGSGGDRRDRSASSRGGCENRARPD